jgi:hypothetical protein
MQQSHHVIAYYRYLFETTQETAVKVRARAWFDLLREMETRYNSHQS